MRGLFFCEDIPVFLCSIYYSFDVVAFNVVGVVVAAHVVVILVVLIFFSDTNCLLSFLMYL